LDYDRTRVIINDRVDLASKVGYGVHLGQEDLPLPAARSLLSASHCIGISTHTLEQAIEAQNLGADYIGCGPTFSSKTKDFSQFSGLNFLRQVAEQTSLPSFAIGGITLERLDEVLATGIRRVAVSHSVWYSGRPAEAAHEYARRLTAVSGTNSGDHSSSQ
jgi:thiamine-phosphate pyrophosphorylase